MTRSSEYFNVIELSTGLGNNSTIWFSIGFTSIESLQYPDEASQGNPQIDVPNGTEFTGGLLQLLQETSNPVGI